MKEFVPFGKIKRHCNVDVIVTEKIDGTNAQINITEDREVIAGSRNRYITTDNDNFGFARWVDENKEELIKLGVGTHYGEWWGSGIQRKYGLVNGDKRFSLFNTARWSKWHPECCSLVPVLWNGSIDDLNTNKIMQDLKEHGSYAVDGFMNPEGIVIYFTEIDRYLKKTFENDKGKWTSNKKDSK